MPKPFLNDCPGGTPHQGGAISFNEVLYKISPIFERTFVVQAKKKKKICIFISLHNRGKKMLLKKRGGNY